jgi:hypothetical protein
VALIFNEAAVEKTIPLFPLPSTEMRRRKR